MPLISHQTVLEALDELARKLSSEPLVQHSDGHAFPNLGRQPPRLVQRNSLAWVAYWALHDQSGTGVLETIGAYPEGGARDHFVVTLLSGVVIKFNLKPLGLVSERVSHPDTIERIHRIVAIARPKSE